MSPSISEARLRANRENAKKSTGPRTVQGKNNSRQNSFKHGLCAQVVDVPGEDPQELDRRTEAFDLELNPLNLVILQWVSRNAARKTMQIDRIAEAQTAEVAKLARQLRRAPAEDRKVDAEKLMKMLEEDPAEAVRVLELTPEGCDVLLREWRLMHEALRGMPPSWDDNDGARAEQLMGEDLTKRGMTPGRFVHPGLMIAKYRETVERIRANQYEVLAEWDERLYLNPLQLELDKGILEQLLEHASNSVLEIRDKLDAEIRRVEARKAAMIADFAIDDREATVRARFDASDRGVLMARYITQAEREFHRLLKEARDATKFALETAAIERVAPIADPSPVVKSDPPPARNEAKGGGSFVVGVEPLRVEMPRQQGRKVAKKRDKRRRNR